MILKIFIVKNFSKVKNFKIKNSYFLWKRLHISSTKEQLHLGFYRHVAFSGVKWRNVTPNILWHNVAKCFCLCNGMLKIHINFQAQFFKFVAIFSFDSNYQFFCDALWNKKCFTYFFKLNFFFTIPKSPVAIFDKDYFVCILLYNSCVEKLSNYYDFYNFWIIHLIIHWDY